MGTGHCCAEASRAAEPNMYPLTCCLLSPFGRLRYLLSLQQRTGFCFASVRKTLFGIRFTGSGIRFDIQRQLGKPTQESMTRHLPAACSQKLGECRKTDMPSVGVEKVQNVWGASGNCALIRGFGFPIACAQSKH